MRCTASVGREEVANRMPSKRRSRAQLNRARLAMITAALTCTAAALTALAALLQLWH
jgi:hypothetical protein